MLLNMEERKNQLLSSFEAFLDEALSSKNEQKDQHEQKDGKKEKLLTSKEVCSYFQISLTTLERRIREGLKYSQAVKKGNRLFRLSDCEKFFNLN
jgi:hypothetical protein